MEEKIIIGAVSAVIIIVGLLCDWITTAIFYIGAIRLCIFLYSVARSIQRNFLQSGLNLEERYGTGSWVFVTGGANGIGLEHCKQFANRNFNLIILDRDEAGLENAKEVISHLHPKVKIETIAWDLSKLTSVKAAEDVLEKVKEKDLAVLVNNAGVVDWFAFNEDTEQSLRDILYINMIAPTLFTSLLYNKLAERKKSGIINIASGLGLLPNILMFTYSMTKAFMIYFATMVNEESKGKVDILTALPGFVNTSLADFKRPSFDKISVETWVSGVLKDLGQNSQTNTSFIHEVLSGIAEILWYTNNELKSLFFKNLEKSTKVVEDFNKRKEQLKKEKNKGN